MIGESVDIRFGGPPILSHGLNTEENKAKKDASTEAHEDNFKEAPYEIH